MISIRWIHWKLCQYIHDEQFISLKLFPITSTRNSGIAQFMICWTEQFQKENVHPKSTTRKLQNESYSVYVKVGIPFLRPCYFVSETCILESYSRYHLPSHTISPAVTGKYPEKVTGSHMVKHNIQNKMLKKSGWKKFVCARPL